MNDVWWVLKDLTGEGKIYYQGDSWHECQKVANTMPSHFKVDKYIHDSSLTALQAKMEKVKEAIRKAKDHTQFSAYGYIVYNEVCDDILKEALKELEAE